MLNRPVEHGAVAVHARQLALDARLRLAPLVGVPLLLCGLTLQLLVQQSAATVPVAALTVLAGMVAALLARPHQRQIARSRAGIRAERRVAARLRRCGAAAVVHNLKIPGRGDVDHVVLGPFAVAVETKHGRGRPTPLGDGRLRVGGKVLPRDPVGQAERAATAVQARLGVPVVPVVAVADASGPPQRAGAVWICSARQLPAVLARLPQVWSDPAAAQRAAAQLVG